MTVGENNPMKGKNDGNRTKGRKRLRIENGKETKHSGIEGEGEGAGRFLGGRSGGIDRRDLGGGGRRRY